ncbi:MAG TPA: ornithine cyclodeaminase family protein [Solirubrobacteraceae bacterium]|nr:ornithine cyclodeaminase family protein [Solirubrobacteraceae bacterium]
MSRLLVFGGADVRAALPAAECAQAMAEVLAATARGETFMPLRSVMRPPSGTGFMGLMPAWRGGRRETRERGGSAATGDADVFALKAICIMPGNPARGLDAHQGTVTLFDGDTGRPRAILDASALTEIRTAAVSAVATRTLARPAARVLAVLGAGVQGRAHVEALSWFEEVRVYAPRLERARALADEAAGRPGSSRRVIACERPEEAVRGADVVVCATSARRPVLRREWLAAGAHVNAVGASTPAARELDTDTVVAAALFCDSRESLEHEAGEWQLARREGLLGEDHVRAELGEVLAGLRPGRGSEEELTVFRSLGLAVEDLAAAELAVARAQRLGVGTEVEL